MGDWSSDVCSSDHTTKNGVSDDNELTSIDKLNAGKPVSERDSDLNDIAANARKAREKEHSELDIPGEIKTVLEGGDPDLEGKPKSKAEPDKEKPKPKEPAEVEMVLVKVNGVEKRVPKADVDAEGGVVAYQKSRSADEKMRQAAEIRKQNELKERELAQRELAISQQSEASLNKDKNPSAKPSTDAPGISAEAKALKDKMYSGDEDQAAEAIDTILKRTESSSTPKIDTNAVVSQATAQVQLEIERKQAVADFKSEYSEIDSNPEYRKYADQATLLIRAENPNWTPRQIIMEAGEQARLKFADQIREKSAAAEDEQRLNNKRTTDNVKGADAKVQPKPAEKPLTQSQIIAQMQSGRSHSND